MISITAICKKITCLPAINRVDKKGDLFYNYTRSLKIILTFD